VVVALSGELFDAIELMAARTGNHKRAAVRMSRLAVQASPSGMSRAEAHMRAGEQWLLADEPATAADEFRAAIADAGPTLDDPRVPLARAMFVLSRPSALDWATAGVEAYLRGEDRAELPLLLRLRYRIRVDLGLAEDDYDKMLDSRRAQRGLRDGPAAGV